MACWNKLLGLILETRHRTCRENSERDKEFAQSRFPYSFLFHLSLLGSISPHFLYRTIGLEHIPLSMTVGAVVDTVDDSVDVGFCCSVKVTYNDLHRLTLTVGFLVLLLQFPLTIFATQVQKSRYRHLGQGARPPRTARTTKSGQVRPSAATWMRPKEERREGKPPSRQDR